MSALRAAALTKRFGRSYAVRDVTFNIGRGEIVGFVGPNGAGKTTTLRMLAGLVKPTRGAAYLLGQPVPSRALLKAGTMIEEPTFYPYLSGRSNLRHAAYLHGGISDRRVDEALEFVKLDRAAGKRVRAYSQGMRQRLALARALLWHPEVLLLDEPTNGLDPTGIAEFREALAEVARSGTTILISSHILSEIEKLVARVLAIDAGELKFDGSLEQLMRAADEATVTYFIAAQHAESLLAGLRELGYEPESKAGGARVVVPAADAPELLYRLALIGVRVTEATQREGGLEGAYLRLVGAEGRPS